MKLQFKFREEAAQGARRALLSELSTQGAGGARKLFPREHDAGLSSLYVVEVGEQRLVRRVLRLLRRSEVVEFAENEARRKLLS